MCGLLWPCMSTPFANELVSYQTVLRTFEWIITWKQGSFTTHYSYFYQRHIQISGGNCSWASQPGSILLHTYTFISVWEVGCCVTCDLLYDTALVPGDRLGTTIFPYELTEVIQLFNPTNSWPVESTIIWVVVAFIAINLLSCIYLFFSWAS